MIDDPKLRELFKAESEEHLQHLDDALLRIEKTPADQGVLEEAFREAHSLKGAARMLGLTHIQAPAHRLEDELNAARHGAQALDAKTITRMSHDLVELRRLSVEAVSPGGAPPRAAVAGPSGATSPGAPAAGAAAPQVQFPPGAEPAPAAPGPATPFLIESVRVDTRKLDALMTHAGELTVTRTRVSRRVADLAALFDSVEEWRRNQAGRPAQPGGGSATPESLARIAVQLGLLRAGFAEDSARLDDVGAKLESGIREARLLPLSNVFRLFPRLVHDLGHEQGKEVELLLEGEGTNADKRILEEIKDPLMHMLRNAVDHGIEAPPAREAAGKPRAGRIRITASQTASRVVIEVCDDGRGLDEEAIRRAAIKRGIASKETLAAMSIAQVQGLIFMPGMTTSGFVTDVSGRGVGMGVVRANVERLKGSIQLESSPGAGTTMRLLLPTTLATVRVLIVQVNGHPYGLPADCVQVLRRVAPEELFTVEGGNSVLQAGRPISIARLADLLELSQPAARDRDSRPQACPCVILTLGAESFGVLVDELLDDQEVVLKLQSPLLKPARNVAGATILDSGEVCMVLEPRDLLASMRTSRAPSAPVEAVESAPRRRVILLAEDSIVTRTQEARILENAGYEVVIAADGLEAWNQLAVRAFDAVVSDVVMPNLDGLGLAEKIRGDARYTELPVILVTSLASDADKRRGLEAGANAYLAKPAFDQQLLLDCLERLI